MKKGWHTENIEGISLSKRRKKKNIKTLPDDYFSSGPFEFARFGKEMVSRSRASSEQFEAIQASMANRLPMIVSDINMLIENITDRVVRLPPDWLLHHAWWEFAALVISLNGKDASDSEQTNAMRMIDYVQSIIASVKPNEPYKDEISEEDWAALKEDVRNLFTKLSGEYQICLSAYRRSQDPDIDMDLEEFRFRAETVWINVRGKHYQSHERQALIDTIMPHSDVLIRLFGIDAPSLIDELNKILLKLTFGLQDVMVEWKKLNDDISDRFDKLTNETGITDIAILRDMTFENTELAAIRDKVVGGLGLDFFDVEKVAQLPKSLLDELTWSPGEDEEFFSAGEFCGWPQRIWPTMKRPFIRLGGRILCFDTFGLFDNFYRVLQRAIFRFEADYKETWNSRQKAVSEELPLTYLQRLLPGSRVYRNVYYRWKSDNGTTQWPDTDGLLLYDDHLFVIEVKAGAFTYTSPTTDLPGHIKSLTELILTPAAQGNRFVDYLESADDVPIFDANHCEIDRLCRSNFRHITICAVTLDPFTELAARAQHLKKVGVDIGQRPVWTLSIDDLRIYADLFDNPLVFLHFVEQRMLAACSELIDLNDEMDHLGLYFSVNNYSQHAAELFWKHQPTKLNFIGYRSTIDKYYSAIIQGEPATIPKQDMPQRLIEILDYLSKSNISRRAELACFLLDSDGELRLEITSLIEQQLQENLKIRRAKPISIYGDMPMTLYVWSPAVYRQAATSINQTRTVMLIHGESSRPLLELEYTAENVLRSVHWQHVGLEGLSHAEIARLKESSDELRKQRVLKVRKQGKIGRNEQCPCGSGRKYKKCCITR